MKQQGYLRWALYIGLGIILFLLPFPRGLFFEKEILPIQIGIFALFILWSYFKILKKEKLKIDSFTMIFVLLLPVVYVLPLVFGVAASRYGALTYVFRYLSYMVIFLILSDFTKTKKDVFLWLNILGISGSIAAFLGIDAGLGKNLSDALGFKGVIDEYGRVRGVLQYSNSFGAYMGIVFFILIALGICSDKKHLKALYSALQLISLTALLMTVSRGAIAFIPFIYILLIILIPGKGKRLEVILSSLPSMVISLFSGRLLTAMIPLIMKNEGQGLIKKGWIITIVSFIAALVISFVLIYALPFLSKISTKIYLIVAAFLGAVSLIGGITALKTGFLFKILPKFLVERFSQIGSITGITSGRNNFYRDGLNILKEHWLLGAGGNAWNSMYRQYQSYFYGSSEAHSLPLQMWLETGLLGILVLILLVVSLFILYFKNRKSESGIIITLVLMPILMLLAHSTLDFNFSYFSLPLMGFALMGCANGIKVKKDMEISIKPWVGMLLGLVIVIFPVSWQIGRSYAVKATKLVNHENVTPQDVLDSINIMEKAIAFNGWNVNYMIREGEPVDSDLLYDLSELYNEFYKILEKNDSNQILILETKQAALVKRAYKLEPYNPFIAMNRAQSMFHSGNIEEGLLAVEKALKLNPMYSPRYQEVAQAYLAVVQFYMEQGDEESAKPYLERIIKLEKDLKDTNSKALVNIEMTEKTKEYIEEAKQLLNS